MQLMPDEAPRHRYLGVSAETGRLGCDALAAAWFAEFYDSARPDGEGRGLEAFLSRPLVEAYPVLHSVIGAACPIGAADCPKPRAGETVEAKIIHLQDEHEYSREQVARWLEGRNL
jgi:hypothetical protein